jgi:hypothetical protein
MTDKCVWPKRPVILFGKFCVSITLKWLNTDSPDIVWQVLRDDPTVVPSGGWVCMTMWITCEPITYFMLNGSVGITGHCITYKIIYVYITI